MTTWTQYRRTNIAEMRPYASGGENLTGISVSAPDQILMVQDLEKFRLGMIARNPQNHDDQWYVARDYFEANFEKIEE